MDKDTAMEYVHERLKIQSAETKISSNPLDLLNEIVFQLHFHLPFQNVRHMAKQVNDREAPSLAANIQSLLKGYGGICWENNSAVCCLLQALGFDADLYLASVVFDSPGEHGNHAVIVVSNILGQEDRFLVDVGFGSPFFEAINLDFNGKVESDEITQSFKTYQLVKRESLYVCIHRKTKEVGKEVEKEGQESFIWHDAYNFRLVKHPVDEIRQSINREEYTNAKSIFNNSVRAMRWIEGRFVCLTNDVLLKEDDLHKLQPEEIGSAEEYLKIIGEYFPEIEHETARKSLTHSSLFTK